MTVTRDVIHDLYPLYRDGVTSHDTARLIEAFLEQDPEFARTLTAQEAFQLPQDVSVSLTKEDEMRTLDMTKSLIRRRSWFMGVAILFTLLPFSIEINDGIRWIFLGSPAVAASFLALGISCWVGYAATNRRLQGTAL